MAIIKRIATEEQIQFSRDFLEQGGIAQRGEFDGDYHQQLFGLIAQVIVSDLLLLPRPINGGFDGGVDLIYNNIKYDVKCCHRNTPFRSRSFCHNLNAKQLNYETEAYIFMSYDKTTGVFEICGEITKVDFLSYATHYNKGEMRPRTDGTMMTVKNDGGMYELKQKFLKQMEALKDHE